MLLRLYVHKEAGKNVESKNFLGLKVVCIKVNLVIRDAGGINGVVNNFASVNLTNLCGGYAFAYVNVLYAKTRKSRKIFFGIGSCLPFFESGSFASDSFKLLGTHLCLRLCKSFFFLCGNFFAVVLIGKHNNLGTVRVINRHSKESFFKIICSDGVTNCANVILVRKCRLG